MPSILEMFTPEQLAELRSLTDTSGRSPIRPRQLDDLTLPPTKDDPRPTFLWSAESPRNAGDLRKVSAFPALMWHKVTGQEITVKDADEKATKTAFYTDVAPMAVVKEPMQEMQDLLDGLSDEDRALVLEAQKQQGMEALQERLAGLSEEQLAALLEKSNPAKRGPGRPRKESAA